MALPVLVTQVDMQEMGYPPVPDAILLRASTRVRRFLRQQLTAGSSTITVYGIGPWLLPQRPVNTITSVVDSAGTPVTDWTLERSRLGTPRTCAPVTVTWTHGWPVGDLPDELVEIVCAIADRMAKTPGSVGAGARTEQAGGESITWGVEAFAAGPALTAAEKSDLRRIYPVEPATTFLI